jgi:uncharacterized protein (DUF302 family)
MSTTPAGKPGAGIISISSQHSVDEAVRRLERMLDSKGLKIFAVVDHSGEAQKAGLQMPNTKLIIFGSPKAGTPLMIAAPTIAIDLPLKILVWEDTDARTWISYNDPEFLSKRYGLPPDLTQTLAGVRALAENIAH